MKRYIVAGRRKRYTLKEALAKAARIFRRTGAIVAVEEHEVVRRAINDAKRKEGP
jgi:hypothetical protein